MYATCFELYLGHTRASQYKNHTKEDILKTFCFRVNKCGLFITVLFITATTHPAGAVLIFFTSPHTFSFRICLILYCHVHLYHPFSLLWVVWWKSGMH